MPVQICNELLAEVQGSLPWEDVGGNLVKVMCFVNLQIENSKLFEYSL
jgi:hypothetical protein